MKKTMAVILAGGEGERLSILSQKRAKPAVPFGGKYRIIDFALSNFVNSGIHSIYVLTQFLSQSRRTPPGRLDRAVVPEGSLHQVRLPAQMRADRRHWYQGTADAIFQNLNLVRESRPHLVCIFGGDHIYRMDVSQMIAFHEQNEADCTVAALPVPIEQASSFGIIQVDDDWRVVGFEEKPKPKPSHDATSPPWATTSSPAARCSRLEGDAALPDTRTTSART